MRVRVRVSGRVQGVGFRYTACAQARERALTGWVRNLPDASVEAEFQGPEDAVEAMIRWCGHGPAAARVDQVSREVCAESADASEFRLRG